MLFPRSGDDGDRPSRAAVRSGDVADIIDDSAGRRRDDRRPPRVATREGTMRRLVDRIVAGNADKKSPGVTVAETCDRPGKGMRIRRRLVQRNDRTRRPNPPVAVT